MKKLMLTKSTAMISMFVSTALYAADTKVKVEITSLENASNAAMEACGTATHSDGLKPLLVTVKHGGSKYTTMSSPDGDWCVLIKRWNYNGQTDADAVALKEVMGN